MIHNSVLGVGAILAGILTYRVGNRERDGLLVVYGIAVLLTGVLLCLPVVP